MQKQRQSILTTTSQKLEEGVRHLFAVPVHQAGVKRLLKAQPLAQRRRFLSRAVRERLWVNLQLLPMTKAGYPVNAEGQVEQIDRNRFKLVAGNLTYVFNFSQVNYVSRLAL